MKCVQMRPDKVIDLCERLLQFPPLRYYYDLTWGEVLEILQRAKQAKKNGLLLYPCEHADEKGICKGFKEGQSVE